MAGRRCLSSKIIESDAFYQLPDNAQTLYMHLNMSADDDGFLNNAANVASRVKGGAAALKKLVERRFILKFDDVYVIKHWRISNSLKNDRLKPLTYAGIATKIWVKPNKAYTDHEVSGCVTLFELRTGTKPPAETVPSGIQLESKMESGWNPVGIQLESGWNPNLTEPNLTEPNLTEPNLTEPKDFVGAFEMILKAYPEGRRGNQQSAEEAFGQVVHSAEDIMLMAENLELWKKSEQWDKDGGRFVPYLVNWLLRLTWRDRPAKMAVPKGASGELGEAELEAIRRVLAEEFDE